MLILFTNTHLIYIAAALIPAIILLVYIYRKDTIEKEPPGLLALLLLGGVLSALLSIVLETKVQGMIDRAFLYADLPYYIITAFVGVAVIEEGTKLLFLSLFSWKSRHFNFLFDAVVYSVFVSLGFAAFENILYVFSYGLMTAAFRAVTSIPGHMSFAVFMGIFYGRAKLCSAYGDHTRAKVNMLVGYVLAVFFHGFYDTCAMMGGSVASLVFLIFVIVMFILVFRLIRASSRADRPI